MLKINKTAKNFLSVGFANLISQFLTFFTIAYYARVISVDSFGRISLAQSIMVYFTMITLFGFQTYGQREIAKDSTNSEKLVGSIISFRLIIAAICFISILIISFAVSKGAEFRNILIIFGFTVFPLSFNIDWYFSGICEMKYNAVYSIIKNTIPFIFIFMFLKVYNNILIIPLFILLGLICAVIYQFFVFYRKKKLKYNLSINFSEIKIYTKAALPFLISALLSMINCNVDSIIIGFMRSERELGIYSSAYKIIFFLTNLMGIIFIPVFPVLISYFNEKNINKLKILVHNICKLVILVAVPICVGGIVLSKEIIVLLFGAKYETAYIPFVILSIYVLILFMRETYGYGLNAFNMEKKYLNIVSISALFNLIFNLIFIPYYGMNAAAVVTVLSEIINFIFMKKFFNTIVNTSYMKNIGKIIIPTFIMFVGIVVLKHFEVNVIINIVCAIFIYFVSVIIFKYTTIDELKVLLKAH